VEFRLLGPLEVHEEGRVLQVGGQKRRALLALLLLHANEVVSSDRLIEEIWGEEPPGSASVALQGHVSRLRKVLLRPAGKDAPALITRPPGYVLELVPDQLDLRRFERLRHEGSTALAEGDPARAASLFEEALALWRGPALADVAYERFAQVEAARLEELRLATVEERIDADLALGRHTDLVPELELLVTEHRFREGFSRQFMLALYRSGRQAEALDAYQQARRALVDELGIEPGQPLRDLEQAILQQDPALEIASAHQEQEVPPSGFVGREEELDHLLQGLEETLRGHGRLYLLVGEPGIGKSRLAEELLRHARRRRAAVLVGRCWEAGGAPAYWPWVQSLRGYVRDREATELLAELGPGAPDLAQILPELRQQFPDLPEPPSLEPEGARFRLFDAVSSFLRAAAQRQPLVIVLDDLHAADEPSLLLLQFLARELADSRLLVVGAYRDVDPTLRDPLVSTLAELTRERVTHRIALYGLDEPGVSEYVELAAGHTPADSLVAAIHLETEGNPLFVGEVVRLLAAEGRLELEEPGQLGLPEGIRQVIGRRLRHLSPECYNVLTLASVLGREFDLDALERVSDTGRERLFELLDEALAARVVSEVPGARGRLRFAHALIRDVMYEALTAARRVNLHREVGEVLEALYRPDLEQHLSELAHQFAQAVVGREAQKAVMYARLAAERAARMLAYEEAVRLYEMALQFLLADESFTASDRFELLLALGDARARAGNTPASKEAFRDAAELAAEHGTPDDLARAAHGYGGRISWEVQRDDEYLRPLLERALAAMGDGDSALKVRLLARLAGGPLRDASFPPEKRHALGKEALESARRIGDPATLAYALAGYINSHYSPDFVPTEVEMATELIALALETGNKELALEGHVDRFTSLIGLGEMSRARRDHAAIAQLAEDLRQPLQAFVVKESHAVVALLEGRFSEAEALISDAYRLGKRTTSWNAVVSYRLQLYVLRWMQGRLEELKETVIRSVDEYPTYPIWRCVQAHAAGVRGSEASAREAFDALAADDFAVLPFDEEWLLSLCFLAETARFLSDVRRASVLYEQLLPYAQRAAFGVPEICIGSVAHYLGVLATTMSHWDDGEDHFGIAIDVNERMGARPWLARSKDGYGRLLLARGRRGDEERARELFAAALQTYRELEMASYARELSGVS
jgi:DNA-binding SARP family transcriptional activator